MTLARRGFFAGFAGLLGGCFSGLLSGRAPTRADVLAWLNAR